LCQRRRERSWGGMGGRRGGGRGRLKSHTLKKENNAVEGRKERRYVIKINNTSEGIGEA